MTTRTNNITDRTGCIEDRTFKGAEKGELNQTPGADLFFTIARDIILATDIRLPEESRLSSSVVADVMVHGNGYTVHNDLHGSEFDGCGFAAKLTDIARDLVDNFDEVFAGSKLNDEQLSRAIELSSGLRRLFLSDYFDITGGELVKLAVDNGAHLITYTGDHSATSITVDDKPGSTYDSREATDSTTDSKPAFNLDENHAISRANEFKIDPGDSVILARMLATSTVRILSGGTITELSEI